MPRTTRWGGELRPTPRTTLRRKRDRGHFDRATINSVLDAGLFCHVGFSVEGSPFVVPMVYARIGDTLYVTEQRRTAPCGPWPPGSTPA